MSTAMSGIGLRIAGTSATTVIPAMEAQEQLEYCSYRVVRGGSWNGDPETLRSAYRRRFSTGHRGNVLGFRVGRTLTP